MIAHDLLGALVYALGALGCGALFELMRRVVRHKNPEEESDV